MTLADAIDKAAREKIGRILKANIFPWQKYDLLDELQLKVVAEHPDGWSADVLGDISKALTKVMYPNGKGGENV